MATDSQAVRSKSVHHVAFTTRDIDATCNFYTEALGMPLIHAENHLHGDGYFRHFFFDVGGGEAIAFFAVEDVGEESDYRTEISTGLGLPVWANHIAFRLDTLDELDAMAVRMSEHGVEHLQRVDHGWCTSIYAADPNGIMVEFCVTTDVQEFGSQTPEQARHLLSLTPDRFGERSRKDGTLGELA